MKKIVLSLAAVVASAVFAPAASALPVFARQTGMACSACHFQHFPLLNGFGRSFKASGFTMSTTNLDGENLSIPSNLNFAGLASMGYEKSNMTPLASANGLVNPGNGSWYVPGTNGEMSLFFGGKVSENAGFLAELGAIGAAGLGSAKLPMLFDVADGTKAGIVAFTTGTQGASYGFEYLNTGANAIHAITNDVGFNGQFINAVSAQQYISTGSGATGLSLVANNSMGFINITKYHQVGPMDVAGTINAAVPAPVPAAAGGTGGDLSSTYIRVAATFDIAGWDSAAGVQNWSGNSTSAALAYVETKATAVDFQMQGEAANMPLGIYVTYATAPVMSGTNNGTPIAGTAATASAFNNGGTDTKSSFNVAAELGVVPGVATVGVAVRVGKSGQSVYASAALAGAAAAGVTNGTEKSTNATDNAIMLTGTYKLAQNQLVRLSYVKQSGDYWDGFAAAATATNADATGSTSYRLSLYSLF